MASSQPQHRVAVLYQALEPPVINGVTKPKKPGGYQDSAADIAYCLANAPSVEVVTPVTDPDPKSQGDWCFPDHEDGILSALSQGATHIWANTILFASHPLQTSARIGEYASKVRLIGQPPVLVEQYDDKELVNNLLRQATRQFNLPAAWTISNGDNELDLAPHFQQLSITFPAVGKPIRGRGSHGVKVCHSMEELVAHADALFKESGTILIEEYLQGEEATVTVMPPTKEKSSYWSLPPVRRFNHQGGIAPYNGVVAVTSNSRVVGADEARHPTYAKLLRQCEQAAALLGTTAPIRIDARRYNDDAESEFALFDVNMKPNMTGPGRSGREDQASLTLLAAEALGWDFRRLLEETLKTSKTIEGLRKRKSVG